ncbi:MAG: hypothetical protein LC634_09715, partial [Sphingomonadales bacterium]|nr:hypothetical protein [Sphingomonadales bacterium]
MALASIFSASTTIIANFLAPGIGTLVGALLGGAIGSLFGGTPESGAHLQWNNATEEFEIGTTWADDWGGSTANDAAEARAIDAATTAGDVLSRLYGSLGDIQALYENPNSPTIAQGAYGQRGDDWLYWGDGENSRTHPLSGEYDNPMDAINHGLEIALGTMTIRGGDRYLKRALYRSIENADASGEFDFSQIIGDLAIGADMSFFEDNRALIDAAIALAPGSALAQGWVLTLLRGAEMDLDQFYKSDFYGGLGGFLDDYPQTGDSYATPGDINVSWGDNGDLVIKHDRETLPSGMPDIVGANPGGQNEARWVAVAGPGGDTVTAMETGQVYSDNGGGGLHWSAPFAIDRGETYQYTIYVRKHDLTAHNINFAASGGTLDAVTGASGNSFLNWNPNQQAANLDPDHWYKIVGVVLPEGQTASDHAEHGGVYDMTTGEKVGDTVTLVWDPASSSTESSMRFRHWGGGSYLEYSTYWYAPSVRRLDASGYPGPSILSIEGWLSNPYETAVIPDFQNVMGYDGVQTTSGNYAGTIYSDIVKATGSANTTLQDSTTVASGEGPGITGKSRLSDDIFIGNTGNNTLIGRHGWDWLDGQGGNDSLYGGTGNDVLIGGADDDYLSGEEGDDRLDGGTGDNQLYGGDRDDILYYSGGTSVYNGGNGSDTLSFEGVDEALETSGSYAIKAHAYNSPSAGAYLADDTLTSIDNLIGSRLRDKLWGNNDANVLEGRDGDDYLGGFDGADTLIGGPGADYLDGMDGLDTASYRTSRTGVDVSLLTGVAQHGDADGDTLVSISHLEGSEFADVLQGWTVASNLTGLGGNDLFLASSGATAFYGGEGVDTVDYSESDAAVTVNVSGTASTGGWAAGDTLTGVEWLVGSDFADSLTGSDEHERFQGGEGNDTIASGGGDDSFILHRDGGYDYVSDSSGLKDYVVVDKEIDLSSFMVRRSGSSLYVRGIGGGYDDRIYINSHFNDIYQSENFLEYVTFANGSSIKLYGISNYQYGWSTDNSATNSPINGTNSYEGDFSHGGAGDDTIHTYDWNDVLIGGKGTDHLYGGDGGDQYVFGRSSDLDYIHEEGGSDVLIIADDISADELLFEYKNDDLHIGIYDPANPDATGSNAATRVIIKDQKTLAGAVETLRIGLQNISLPAYMGDLTGSNT